VRWHSHLKVTCLNATVDNVDKRIYLKKKTLQARLVFMVFRRSPVDSLPQECDACFMFKDFRALC